MVHAVLEKTVGNMCVGVRLHTAALRRVINISKDSHFTTLRIKKEFPWDEKTTAATRKGTNPQCAQRELKRANDPVPGMTDGVPKLSGRA